MARNEGQIRVEYEGSIPQAFKEYLASTGVRVTAQKPLTLRAARAEDVLNDIRSFVNDSQMGVRRIEYRPAR
jgi:hypothetical protein